MSAMKWWGWGLEEVEFTHSDKPALAPFIKANIGVNINRPAREKPHFADLTLPPPDLPATLQLDLEQAVYDGGRFSQTPIDRVQHARGKSLRDLVLQRRGEFPRLPDAVVWPANENQVAAIMSAVVAADAVLIPFGGGSSISGSLEPAANEERPVISLDLGRMNRVLEIDEISRLARIQAGASGPELERQLGAAGMTLGHFPDSFTHSTLGGWIATRSSGMQSDQYGDIADLVRGMRVVTPGGTLDLKPLPAASNGPALREMILGSEGRLGVITEAHMKVRPLPDKRIIIGYLFPSWAEGLAAMRDLAAGECHVSVSRLSDAAETRFTFATRRNPTLLDRAKSKGLSLYLERRRNFNLEEMCLSFVGYEGSERYVAAQRREAEALIKAHGGVPIGSGPGELYDQKKFDTPYIRDFLLNYGVLADVSETAAPWSRLPHLYESVMEAGWGTFDRLDVPGYLMCHLSHSYHDGACLYFTFAINPSSEEAALEEYDEVKQAIQQAFVDSGGTLSHHHAVGTEHSRWLEQDVSSPGVAMLDALFAGVDPGRNLNPGKIR